VIGERLLPFLTALGIETYTVPMTADPRELAEAVGRCMDRATENQSIVALLGVPQKFSEDHLAQG
jgi:hypothetical protein